MTHRICLGLLMTLFSAIGSADAADRIGEFEVHDIRFTGGEYQNERFQYVVLPPPEVEAGKTYPLVFFLHGAGERGTDPAKLLVHFPAQMARPEWRGKYPCYLVAPQCRDDRLWMNQHWSEKESKPLDDQPNDQMAMAIAVLEQSLRTLPVDRRRVYLTGLSMGGYGSWELAMRHPEWFAALAPVCGGGDESRAGRLKSLPIWTAHGDADTAVWPIRSRRMVEAVNAAGGSIRYTEYAGVGHNSWTPFHTDPEGVVPWMFQQRRPE